MIIALATDEAARALGDGVRDDGFEAGEGGGGDHCSDVDFVWVLEGVAYAEGADARFQ